MQPSYVGLLLAALCLLATAAHAAFRRGLPRELCALSVMAAALSAGSGFVLQARWEFGGPLFSGLSPEESVRAARLFVSPIYLDALGVSPDAASALLEGIRISTEGERTRADYHLTGFRRGSAHSAATTWVAHAPRETAGMVLAARLQCTRSREDIVRALGDALPLLGRPSRLVLRQLLPELRDRFPGACAPLDDFARAIGAVTGR